MKRQYLIMPLIGHQKSDKYMKTKRKGQSVVVLQVWGQLHIFGSFSILITFNT